MHSDHQPRSASLAASSSLWWSFSNCSMSAGLTSLAAKSRSARTKSCCSSESTPSVLRVSVASSMLRLPLGPRLDGAVAGRLAPVVRGVVLAPAVDLAQRDHHLVHLVRAVRQPQHAEVAPENRERSVVGYAERAVDLDRAVEDVHHDVG